MKDKLIIDNDGRIKDSNNNVIDVATVYDEEFLEGINIGAAKVKWKSDYINEVFLYFFIKIKELIRLYEKESINKIEIKGFCSNWTIFIAAAIQSRIPISKKLTLLYYVFNICLYLFSFVFICCSSLLLPIVILFKRRKRIAVSTKDFAVIRTPAAYDKIKFMDKHTNIDLYFGDFAKNRHLPLDIYGVATIKERLLSLLEVPAIVFRDFILLTRDTYNLLGIGHLGYVSNLYLIRISHKATYEYFLKIIMKKRLESKFYTGNKEDRFAILEKRLCKSLGVTSICIPHGVEYAFRMPAGLVGSKFYCTTNESKKHLEVLYARDNEFLFSKQILKGMFGRNIKKTVDKKIVFFTEARGRNINIAVIELLSKLHCPFYIKLHPKDDASKYEGCESKCNFIDDFELAISNSVCLARKSTVLVEAIYNNSKSIAVLFDPMDRVFVEWMIPSLNDSQIMRVYTPEELLRTLSH